MKSIKQILDLSKEVLEKKKVLQPKRSAEDLLSSILQVSRMELYMDLDKPLTESSLERMREALKRRLQGEPVDYILGQMQFFDLNLHVDSDVLIPRPETEILLHTAKRMILEDLDIRKDHFVTSEPPVLWDICTGSGCMGLGMKKKISDLKVVLSDISPKAITIAKKNAEKNQLEVEALEGDLFAPFSGKKADFIFFNPPYISTKEYTDLHDEVRSFEPKNALHGGKTGLELYQRFKEEVINFIKPGAKIFMEIGHSQGEELKKIFSSLPCSASYYEKDWSGNDRFFFLEFE